MKAYHGLVLLSVKGFTGVEEAARLRDKLSGLPQTMIAFVGSSGRSVKILVPFLRPDGSLPVTVEEAGFFHAHAYQWAVNFTEGSFWRNTGMLRLRIRCRNRVAGIHSIRGSISIRMPTPFAWSNLCRCPVKLPTAKQWRRKLILCSV